MIGIFGKLPAHGDFIRRELPVSFTGPWDTWVSNCIGQLAERIGHDWGERWDALPVWRFRIAAGVCGPQAVTGVLLPSQDAVGRRFPLTIARVLESSDPMPPEEWYLLVAREGQQARDGRTPADLLVQELVKHDHREGWDAPDTVIPPGWSTDAGAHFSNDQLPSPEAFSSALAEAVQPVVRDDSASPADWLPRSAAEALSAQVVQVNQAIHQTLSTQVDLALRELQADALADRFPTVESAAPVVAPPPAPAAEVELQAPLEFRWISHAVTHPGTVRNYNEDSFVDRPDLHLWAVADGVGGQRDGGFASTAIATALGELPAGLSAGEILAQVRLRLDEVHARLQPDPEATETGRGNPASTVVVLLSHRDHFACLWAGDSRAYLLRDGRIAQLTRDHSYVQELVDSGAVLAEDAEQHPEANAITRAIGAAQPLELDKVHGKALPGDILMLCSDGLYKVVPESRIAEVLASGGRADDLVAAALEAGARDNVTALTVEVHAGQPREAEQTAE